MIYDHVLITGGTGFVGRWFEYWLEMRRGSDVISLDRAGYEAVAWDDFRWDAIVHLAPVAPTRVIECAKRCGARVLFASSGEVYHSNPNQYGLDKIAAEQELARSGVDYVVARMFAFMGGWMNYDYFAAGTFIKQAIENHHITIRGNGMVRRTYLYGLDMAEWLWAILERGKSGHFYDVGGEQPVTLIDLANEVAANFIPQPDVTLTGELQDIHTPFYYPNYARRTREELGVSQRVSFRDAVRLTIHDYEEGKR